MTNKSLFQTIFLLIFAAAVVVAVLIFAGILPGFRAKKIGQAGNLIVWGSFTNKQFLQLMSDELPKGHEQEFTLAYTVKGEDFEIELINALASGNGPDVIIAPQELLLKHRDKLTWIPYKSLALNTYQNSFVDESSLFINQDGYIALPLVIDPLVFYYNKDLYNNANLISAPTNWEEFLKIQPVLTKIGQRHKVEQSAFALGTFGNNSRAKDILSFLILQAGGSPAGRNGNDPQVTLGNEIGSSNPSGAALSFFLQFADPLKSTYCWNNSLPEAREAFLGETLASYFGFGSEATYLREKNPHLNFNLAIVPQMTGKNRSTFGRLYGVAVLKTTAKSSAAWKMVFALAGEKLSKQTADILNMAPVRRSLLVADPVNVDQPVIYDSALISRGWFDFSSVETKNIFQTMTQNASTGRLTPGDAVSQAAQEMSKLIGSN